MEQAAQQQHVKCAITTELALLNITGKTPYYWVSLLHKEELHCL